MPRISEEIEGVTYTVSWGAQPIHRPQTVECFVCLRATRIRFLIWSVYEIVALTGCVAYVSPGSVNEGKYSLGKALVRRQSSS